MAKYTSREDVEQRVEDVEQRLETLRRAKTHSERGLRVVAAKIVASGDAKPTGLKRFVRAR